MRRTVSKRLRDKAIVIAKEMFGKTTSVKTERNTWQKGSPKWCYKQLKKEYHNANKIRKPVNTTS